MNDVIVVNHDIHVYVADMSLEVIREIRPDVIYSRLKDVWLMYQETMGLGFPLQLLDDDTFQLNEPWSFKDANSYCNVVPHVMWNKPALPVGPLAPSTTVMHPTLSFKPGISLEDLVAALPKGTNLKSSRIHCGRDGRVYMSVPGTWPNPRLEQDKVQFVEKMKAHRDKVNRWKRTIRIWDEVQSCTDNTNKLDV